MEMNKKIKIIDLLCLISVGEEAPKKIKYRDEIYEYDDFNETYYTKRNKNLLNTLSYLKGFCMNEEIEILDEEDKDIPLIPDDELCIFKGDSKELNYNFRVLKEKINQVVEEFNEYRKDNE